MYADIGKGVKGKSFLKLNFRRTGSYFDNWSSFLYSLVIERVVRRGLLLYPKVISKNY